jgi:tetratricopeptide (TPR) repeat protein
MGDAMRTLRAAAAVLVCCATVSGGVLHAALAQKVPKRPKLPEGADTNSAAVYYQYGVDIMRDKPGTASDAFYWAHRLLPDWPDPLYARWVASLLDLHQRLPDYLEGNKRFVRSKEVRAIDSLYLQALSLNPFVYRHFDRMLFDEYLDVMIRRYEGRSGQVLDRGATQLEFEQEINRDPDMRAWMQYSQGRFADAVESYGMALKGARNKAGVLAARARASFLNGDYDGAMADMTAAVEVERKTDEKDLVYLYDSKAIFEHSIGIVHELRHEPAAAREAYARALEEDLSYYQAHVRLATLALAAADTATAISEYDLAAQIRPQEPIVQYQLGNLLVAQGHGGDAVEHFKAAIAADSVYAPPYFQLARDYEATGHPDSAPGQYEAFLAHAAQNNAALPDARARARALNTAKTGEPKP